MAKKKKPDTAPEPEPATPATPEVKRKRERGRIGPEETEKIKADVSAGKTWDELAEIYNRHAHTIEKHITGKGKTPKTPKAKKEPKSLSRMNSGAMADATPVMGLPALLAEYKDAIIRVANIEAKISAMTR